MKLTFAEGGVCLRGMYNENDLVVNFFAGAMAFLFLALFLQKAMKIEEHLKAIRELMEQQRDDAEKGKTRHMVK